MTRLPYQRARLLILLADAPRTGLPFHFIYYRRALTDRLDQYLEAPQVTDTLITPKDMGKDVVFCKRDH